MASWRGARHKPVRPDCWPASLPVRIVVAGEETRCCFLEFPRGQIRNPQARRAYGCSTAACMAWCEMNPALVIAATQALHVAAWIKPQAAPENWGFSCPLSLCLAAGVIAVTRDSINLGRRLVDGACGLDGQGAAWRVAPPVRLPHDRPGLAGGSGDLEARSLARGEGGQHAEVGAEGSARIARQHRNHDDR